MLIYSADDGGFESARDTRWRAVSDRVMGGVSRAGLELGCYAGRQCLHLSGEVLLDNDGGFIQMALDLAADGGTVDATAYKGISLAVAGNGETYGVHLRTSDLERPWQSYRATFVSTAAWRDVQLPFSLFAPHRVTTALDLSRLRRIGLVAIGRHFHASLRVSRVALYGAAGAAGCNP